MPVAFIIDGDANRRGSFAQALTQRGVHVNGWTTGARGLVALRGVPGVDVILVASDLPDLTVHQIASEIRQDPRMAETPVLVIPASEGADDSLYGEHVTGVVASAAEMELLDQALEASVNTERELASELAVRAASTLDLLARSGVNLQGSADALAQTLAGRPDDVVLPSLRALSAAGTAAHVQPIAGGPDRHRPRGGRPGGRRQRAGWHLRPAPVPPTARPSRPCAASRRPTSRWPFGSRPARALGRLNLTQEMRAELIRGVYSK